MELKVEGTSYFRDIKTNALVNKDVNGLEEYKAKRKFAESQRQEINNLKKEMECIKGDVQEIKELMRQLLNKG
jgi:FtsZ-binding cell division protein ZapB